MQSRRADTQGTRALSLETWTGRPAARRFFDRAIGRTRIHPTEVTSDRYRVYPGVLHELLPTAFHRTGAHANNPIQADHGRLKARLRPMRGLKRDRTARVIVAGHAFIQILRRGFYDLGTGCTAGRSTRPTLSPNSPLVI